MAERSHLSIGEVLSLLREEFPDVTISKIRFLESQGLVDPERTPSGYRKFYDHDVERLRWILRQQRENFLPLKVIRGRLSEQGELIDDGPDIEGPNGRPDEPGGSDSGRLFADPEPSSLAMQPVPAMESAAVPAASTGSGRVGSRSAAASSAHPAAAARRAAVQAPDRREPAAASNHAPVADAAPDRPEPAPAAAPSQLTDDGDSYSAEELAASSGNTVLMVRELEQFGLISPHAVVAGTPYFDGTALAVAKAAAGFARHGVEARHLRVWRNAADREAGLFEQVVMPLLRQRNPEARRRASATLSELSGLGADLRRALIDHAVRQIR